MKSSLVVLFGFLATVSALPIPTLNRRQLPQRAINDVDILQFALSLENLEASFYFQGLSQFSEADFRRENIPNPTQTFQNFHHILQHEIQHVKTLQTVISSLGGTPVPPCEYNFPFRTVQEFMAIANSLEKVGVSAYNGALAIMQSPDLQTAAATIDTVEARHASFLQTANGGDPFPENFDVALDGRQIITLASPFIRSCSFDLGLVPFGTLQVSNQIHLPESNVAVTFQQVNSRGQNFCNWLFADQSVVVPLAGNLCQIPPGARGDVYLMITNDQTPINLKKTDTIVAGPAIVTIDTAHTDSCKELFSGKKLKDGSVNQPIESGSIPVNGAIPQSGVVSPGTPSPSGVPPSTVSPFPPSSTSQLPPSSVTPIPPLPSNVSAVPTIGQAPSSDIVDPNVNPTTNVPIDVNAQDPVIQEMFAELYATENGSPLPETSPSTTSPSPTEPTTLTEPTVDPATGLPVEPAVDPATGLPLPTDLPVNPSPTTSPSDVPLESPPAEFTTPGSETQDLVDPAQETTLAGPSVDPTTGLPVDPTTGLPLDPSLPSTEPPVE